jgi:hypothetical protein
MREDPAVWEDAGMDSPFYCVACTDTRAYVHWQCELLEYSWKQVAQRGELLRLVSRRESEAVPRHIHARVISTAYGNVDPGTGDEYAPYNRLFSLREWLDSEPEPGTVLILDPDCVFRDRVSIAVSPGAPIAQPWWGFAMVERWRAAVAGLSGIDPQSVQGITWPALIHTEDLKALLPRWIELTARLRRAIGAWESDMMALVVTAAEMNLKFMERHLAAVTNRPEEEGKAPIIHYCQAIEASDGSRLWFKQNYEPWEDTGVDPAEPGLDYCGDLIAILNEFIAIQRPRADSKPDADAARQGPAARMPDRFLFKVSLRSNAVIEIDCRSGDPVVADLFRSLVANSETNKDNEDRVLCVPTRGGTEARFHSSQITAIETIPLED